MNTAGVFSSIWYGDIDLTFQLIVSESVKTYGVTFQVKRLLEDLSVINSFSGLLFGQFAV